MTDTVLSLRLQSQQLERNERGYNVWRTVERPAEWPAARTAILLCDVWDTHTCRGAVERLEGMVARIDQVARACRDRGVLVVHAPSDTVDACYADHPARQRARQAPPVEPPADVPHEDPPPPVCREDCCDTDNNPGQPGPDRYPWTRQHPAVHIDAQRDLISAKGLEILAAYRQRGIENMLIMGVHTNMCILHRTFGIKQMVRWGLRVALVRDLTDAMYNPACWPYVSHDEGTALVVGYIEKFWAPTVASEQLL